MASMILAIVPAYNEEKTIGPVVEGLFQQVDDVVVVDDGSLDRTAAVARAAGATVLVHAVNRGQGAALRTGIAYALQEGADTVVTFDADGQHRAADLPRLLEPVLSGKVDIALGSRFLSKRSRMPLARRVVLRAGVVVQWVLYGIKLTDAHNGLRAMSRRAAEAIRIDADRMEHASEIVEEVKRHRLRYREVPVTILYSRDSLARGQSSWNSLRIGAKMLLKKLL